MYLNIILAPYFLLRTSDRKIRFHGRYYIYFFGQLGVILNCNRFSKDDSFHVVQDFYFLRLDGDGWFVGLVVAGTSWMDGSYVKGTLGGCSLHILSF